MWKYLISVKIYKLILRYFKEPLADINTMNMSYIKTLQQNAIEMGVKPKCQ